MMRQKRSSGRSRIAKKTKQMVQPRALEHEHASCKALGQVLDRVGDKWTVLVVGGLSKGPMRFNALLRLIGGPSSVRWEQLEL